MKTESEEEFVDRIKRKVKENLEEKLAFGEKLVTKTGRNNGLTPFPGQIMRVYEPIENGTKRIIFADATGFGKTYVACMILGLLNERKNKRHKSLIIAPRQSIETAWTEEEINSYISGLGLNGRKLKTIELNRYNLENIAESLRGRDIIYVNYHKFDCGTCDRYVDAVLKIAPKIDLIIFDECHNNKGFKKRGSNIKKLIDKTRNKRVLLLSATPGHNGLEDLGIPLHILDPENFPFDKYDYNADPTAIKDMILSGQWFNSDREIVAKLFNLPKLTIKKPVFCDIGEYAKDYLEVWKNGDLDITTKIALLRKFSLLGKIKSKEGKKCLQELLESFPKEHGLITFTHLKTGVSQELFEFLENFYGKGKVARINGDVKREKRIEISKRFTNGEYKAISNSFLTMGEGAPCTTGERPARVLFYEMPYNHGQENQGIGRVYRPGQKGDAEVYYIIGKNEWLASEMIKLVESGELEKKYNVKFPRNWRASTICLDIYDIMRTKDRTDKNYVIKGLTLTDFQQAIMRYDENSIRSKKEAERVGVFKSLPKKIEKESPMSFFTRKANPHLCGIGETEMYKASQGKGDYKTEFEYMREAYFDERIFDTSAGDTARLIKQVVESLEEKGVVFNNLLDLGCGSGVISRVLEREMTNFDLDEKMLYPEKFYRNRKFFGLGKRVHGFMTNLPFKDDSFDLAIASYSLFYNKQKDNKREIEKTLLETNRVLKPRGYFISSLIRTTTEEDFKTLNKAIEDYGFNVLLGDFFKGYKEDNRKSKFPGVYLIVSRKETNQENYIDGGFSIYTNEGYRVSRGRTIKTYIEPNYSNSDSDNVKIKKFRKINSHSFRNLDGISLDEMLKNINV